MGNSLGGKRTAKIMKINGETIKLKTPVVAGEVLKDYPDHILLESEAVKHFGIRAKPLEPRQNLKPKRLYFLVELPKFPEEKAPRRVRSGINVSAKDRLESLMLARRSVSDLTIMKPARIVLEEEEKSKEKSENSAVRLKMRLPKAEVEKLMMESKDEAEAAEKIVDLCMSNNIGNSEPYYKIHEEEGAFFNKQVHWNGGHGGVLLKAREKRVSFLPVSEAEIQLTVTS